LGSREDITESKFYEFVKKFNDDGATILGGCCEIRPSHIKNIAKKCAGLSKSFNKIIDNVKFDSSLPISIQNSIEKCLRRKLGVKPDDLNFYGLISIGKDSGLLNEEALDYLHTIRKQRNIFAHTEVGAQTRFSRISFVLNSAALLWSHLECGSK
jgi:hypothetical protein